MLIFLIIILSTLKLNTKCNTMISMPDHPYVPQYIVYPWFMQYVIARTISVNLVTMLRKQGSALMEKLHWLTNAYLPLDTEDLFYIQRRHQRMRGQAYLRLPVDLKFINHQRL